MIIGRKKYWKNVKKEKQTDNLFRIYLDEICLKSDKGNNIKLSAQLADEVVREWSADGKIESSYIQNDLRAFCEAPFLNQEYLSIKRYTREIIS